MVSMLTSILPKSVLPVFAVLDPTISASLISIVDGFKSIFCVVDSEMLIDLVIASYPIKENVSSLLP